MTTKASTKKYQPKRRKFEPEVKSKPALREVTYSLAPWLLVLIIGIAIGTMFGWFIRGNADAEARASVITSIPK